VDHAEFIYDAKNTINMPILLYICEKLPNLCNVDCQNRCYVCYNEKKHIHVAPLCRPIGF